jgi:hypothetical protein
VINLGYQGSEKYFAVNVSMVQKTPFLEMRAGSGKLLLLYMHFAQNVSMEQEITFCEKGQGSKKLIAVNVSCRVQINTLLLM